MPDQGVEKMNKVAIVLLTAGLVVAISHAVLFIVTRD
jgi:hypothetical protein